MPADTQAYWNDFLRVSFEIQEQKSLRTNGKTKHSLKEHRRTGWLPKLSSNGKILPKVYVCQPIRLQNTADFESGHI